ncbi:MAG TPA: UvrD-helicase domain-containing protein, partial [Acidobacteriota bacterium]|nr:UvrD-helicase domain-containing protein [Acidobacteriota bacterium]
MNLLDDLNSAQRAAVEYTDGPQLVVAGAGSGKTRVITYKVVHLIATGRFAAEHILAVTFTNKAADEMRERIHALLGPGRSATPTVCTFHSFCARFLRQEIGVLGFSPNYTICDADDQARLVKDILKELHIAEPPVSVDMIVGRIGRAKIHAITPAQYATRFRDADADLLGEIFGRYERRLTASGALDFEDLILKSNAILERCPDIRTRLAHRYRYLLVDEFQDTNPPQYKLVQLLGGEHRNLCVVGDEDQSIYGFRGAILANILNFERDFPGAKLFKLEQNYRSTRAILRAASGLVAHNRQRREKSLWTDN